MTIADATVLGRISGLSIADYHAAEAVSHSKLETFRHRALLYYKRHVVKTLAAEESPAYALGSALHCLVLEPTTYGARYATAPEGLDRRTKEGKAEWAAFCAANEGKALLKADDASLICEMDAAIHSHAAASALLAAGQPEVTWRVASKSLPVPLQCRTDWFNGEGCELSDGRPYVADLKTCDSIDQFNRNFTDYGYHRQAGFYLPLLYDCGATVTDFFLVAVEKEEAFGVGVYRISDDAIATGQDETLQDLARLAKCYRDNNWPNTPTTVQEIALPGWYGKESA